MKRKIIFLLCIIAFILPNICFASDVDTEDIGNSLGLADVVNTLKEYTSELDIEEISGEVMSGEGINYGYIGNFILEHLFSEIKGGIKIALSVIIILVLLAVIKSLELEKDGTIANVTNLIGFLLITTILLKNYAANLQLFTETIKSLTQIVSIISPVMLGILIATGEIVTSGIISPIILFLTSVIGIAVTYVIVPLLTLSLVLSIITSCSNVVKLDKLSGICKTSAMWIVSVIFALFLGVLGLESSISTSIDGVTIKTTQAAVSNLVPVVGKFLSDSLEVVMGASELIGKGVGIIGIIVLIIVLVIPLIKLIIISIIYKLLEAFSEAMLTEDKLSKIIGAFAKQYASISGVLIGVGATFIIAIGIVMSLFGKAVGG